MANEHFHLMSPSHIYLRMGKDTPDKEIKITNADLLFEASNGCNYNKTTGSKEHEYLIAKGAKVNFTGQVVVFINKAPGDQEAEKSILEIKESCDSSVLKEKPEDYKKKFMFTITNSASKDEGNEITHISFDGFVTDICEIPPTNDSNPHIMYQVFIAVHDMDSFHIQEAT